MKTEQEIYEADEAEERIKIEKEEADKQAYTEFNKATASAWKEYEEIWKPAREKWEKFFALPFKKLQAELVKNNKRKDEALIKVRKDWQVCPECGTSASRFQVFCSNKECELNLVTARSKQ